MNKVFFSLADSALFCIPPGSGSNPCYPLNLHLNFEKYVRKVMFYSTLVVLDSPKNLQNPNFPPTSLAVCVSVCSATSFPAFQVFFFQRSLSCLITIGTLM